MSKTDNTRPYHLQYQDKSLPGVIEHSCGHGHPCDYHPRNGVIDFRAEHVCGRGGIWSGTICTRRAYYHGGIQAATKGPQRWIKRQARRERRRAARQAVKRMIDPQVFDVLPVRADRRSRP